MDQRRPDSAAGLVGLSGGAQRAPAMGKVWLVGAGPGDPELLTRRAERVLRAADVVVHDRLVSADILALAAPDARRLYVGKRKSNHSVPQADLNGLLVALGREGLQVVRLKGGDPFVFGRGGEELAACRRAGVDCEVVPGVSAALAAAAACGAPLTHRGMAQSVTFVTGHAAIEADGAVVEPELDWTTLARANQTGVVYMGLSSAPVIAGRLIQAGRAAATPALIVEHASRPNERRALCTLADLPEVAQSFAGPAVLIIGEVAALAQVELALQSPPLEEEWLAARVECASAIAAHRESRSAPPPARPEGERLSGRLKARA